MDFPHIDSTRPSVARVYDAGLGGKDNYEVDREVLRAIDAAVPNHTIVPRDNREWLIRITRYLAGQVGVTQFLDLGSGLPTAENTHQIAQRVNPEATVVYVDNDPMVLAHGRALLEENDRTHFLSLDLTRPSEVFEHPDVRRYLDFSEPLALYQIGTLHHLKDTDAIREIMREYVDRLAPGSYLAVSHFHDPGGEDGQAARELERVMSSGPMGSGYFRSREDIESFFGGLDLVPPGLVHAPLWWPDGPQVKPLITPQRLFLAGLAHKK